MLNSTPPQGDLTINILSRIFEKSPLLPEGYQVFFDELWRETPISSLLPSYDKEGYSLFNQYLDKKIDIFDDTKLTIMLYDHFPVIALCIRSILNCDNKTAKGF